MHPHIHAESKVLNSVAPIFCLGGFLKKEKRKGGKEQVGDSYQPGNIGSMAGTIPSVKKKKK